MSPTRASPRGGALLVTGAAVLLVLIGAGCHTDPSASYVFPEESAVIVLAPQADHTLKMVERGDFEPGSAAGTPIDATPTGGVTRTVAGLLSDRQLATVSFTSAPLGRTLYLDLDQAVGGQLFISNMLGAASSPESVRIITELYVDGALAGGSIYEHTVYSTETAAWDPVPVYFRPEVAVLAQGSVVELRVSGQGGLLDLQLGIGGDHASRAEIAYYPFDPLAGAVFLEKGKLVSAVSDGNATGNESLRAALEFMDSPAFEQMPPGHYVVRAGVVQDAPHVGGLHPALLLPLPLLLLGFVGGPRRPQRPLAAMLVVAIVALAGCSGGATDVSDDVDPETPKPRVDSKFEDVDEKEAKEQREAQVGSIRGVVTNYFGLPVKAAHISILATNKFASSDAEGTFEIVGVPAGIYTMRVDAQELDSLEKQIEVQVAKVTRLKVVLVPPEGTRPDKIQHLHDEWRGAAVRQLDKVTVEPQFYFYTQTVGGIGGQCAYSYHAEASYGTSLEGNQCSIGVPFDFEKKVLPGTSLVEVVLDWDDGGSNIPALGITYQNGARPTPNLNTHLPRGPGEPFYIHVFPNQADPGHQLFTNWQFTIFAPGSDAFAPRDGPYDMSDIEVTARIHKGIVPYEPKHVDRWEDKTQFVLADGTEEKTYPTIGNPQYTSTYQYEKDGWVSADNAVWSPIWGSWVPSGTMQIEGRLVAEPYRPAAGVAVPKPPHIEYGLGYKAANVPPTHAQGNLAIAELVPDGDDYTFVITPTDKELDSWYQTSSQWQFWLLFKAPADMPYHYYNHGFMLEAKAVRDPTWNFEESLE